MEVVKRTACRAILLNRSNEVLLIRIENPAGPWNGWITPGGGREDGESDVVALKRELNEELGLVDFELGPKIWNRFHSFVWKNKIYEQSEVFYLIKTNDFIIQPNLHPDATELVDHKEFRWWTIEEVRQTQDHFSPRRLGSLLTDLLETGAPSHPLEIID